MVGAKQYKEITFQLRKLLKEFSLHQEEEILSSGDLKAFFQFVSNKLKGRTTVATLKKQDKSFASSDRDKCQLLNAFLLLFLHGMMVVNPSSLTVFKVLCLKFILLLQKFLKP